MMNAFHRGRAQGMLLYPRPGFTRQLADLLLTALHIEYGKPETDGQHAMFLRGYAEGQRTMEDAMDKQDAAKAATLEALGTTGMDYVQRLETMLAEANKRANGFRAAFETVAELLEYNCTPPAYATLEETRAHLKKHYGYSGPAAEPAEAMP